MPLIVITLIPAIQLIPPLIINNDNKVHAEASIHDIIMVCGGDFPLTKNNKVNDTYKNQYY